MNDPNDGKRAADSRDPVGMVGLGLMGSAFAARRRGGGYTVLEAMVGALRPGQIIVDTTIGDPDVCVRAGHRWSELGGEYLDAMVSGNADQVRAGETTIMAGGPRAGFAACANLLRLFADGRRELTTARKVQAHGTTAAPGTAWHRFSLRCRGTRIVASLGGTPIANVRDTTCLRGWVGLVSRFHPAQFDNLAIAIPPSP